MLEPAKLLLPVTMQMHLCHRHWLMITLPGFLEQHFNAGLFFQFHSHRFNISIKMPSVATMRVFGITVQTAIQKTLRSEVVSESENILHATVLLKERKFFF